MHAQEIECRKLSPKENVRQRTLAPLEKRFHATRYVKLNAVPANMTILAFDTCFNACSVAVGTQRNGKVEILSDLFEEMATGQAERLIPMISQALHQANRRLSDVGMICVTTGPGTFTGTRIGVAAAKALALTNKIPIVGLSSLHVMAREAAVIADMTREIGVAVDVKRNEVYVQVFDNRGMNPRSAPSVRTVHEARATCRGNTLWVGSGAALLTSPDTRSNRAAAPALLPRAAFALDLLSHDQSSLAALGSSPRISPVYLRAPDAKPSASAALQRQ
jgi:tRNA threonylcarbamoyladenosine biosynthesis protein TsaB